MSGKKKTKTKRARKAKPTAAVLVLRTVNADMTSHGGFVWPKSGPVKCNEWSPEPKCGNGLHGLLWGEGDGELLDWSERAKWLVVSVSATTPIADIGGKVKFQDGEVVFCGDRKSATDYIIANGAAGKAVVGGTATAGDRGTATAGDWGTATAGDRGTATAGDRGTATAGYGGTATAGDWGILMGRMWDSVKERWRMVVGYVGEDGIEPNKPYHVVDGKLVEKKE